MNWIANINKQEPYDVYIGRPTKWSNPYRIGFDGTRKEVLEMYEEYLYGKIDLILDIRRELKGKILGCYCFPMKCHGELLSRIANGFQLPPLNNED